LAGRGGIPAAIEPEAADLRGYRSGTDRNTGGENVTGADAAGVKPKETRGWRTHQIQPLSTTRNLNLKVRISDGEQYTSDGKRGDSSSARATCPWPINASSESPAGGETFHESQGEVGVGRGVGGIGGCGLLPGVSSATAADDDLGGTVRVERG
jgi:hypothetical protein